jgi:hypothetical protein
LNFPNKYGYIALTLNVGNFNLSNIDFFESIDEAIESSNFGSRISPIFPLFEDAKNSVELKNRSTLIFVNNLKPTDIDFNKLSKEKIWLTLGIFNIVILVSDVRRTNNIKQWLNKIKKNYEVWELKANKIIEAKYKSNYNKNSKNSVHCIKTKQNELQNVIDEYNSIIKILYERSKLFYPEIISDLEVIHDHISAKINNCTENSVYDDLAEITNINAGLSRFSSQTFSGISPVRITECHFWSNSLLGIGIANIALINIRRFVQKKIGELRLNELLDEQLYSLNPIDISVIQPDDDYWKEEHLNDFIKNSKTSKDEIVPLITYFSGRDGFKSYINTLSAPLESISSCNTLQWSLLTITHEISHNIVKAILSVLHSQNGKELSEDHFDLYKQNRKPKNLLESIQKYFFNTILNIEVEENDTYPDDASIDFEQFIDILTERQRKIEELITHIFDFVYFYHQNIEIYLKELWITWSVIPKIKTRIPDYIIRSICAISFKFLYIEEYHDLYEICKNQFLETLETLKKEKKKYQYIDFAIKYISDNSDEIKNKFLSRLPLIKIFKTFLYSDTVITNVYKEKYGEKSWKNNHRISEFNDYKISNPIKFIKKYSQSKSSKLTNSLWILYNFKEFYLEMRKKYKGG